MSLERYLRDEHGFRKYVELMESTPTTKRKKMMDAARRENPLFVETAEKYVLTFERITKLPEMELAEVLGSKALKSDVVAVAILSVEDVGVRERLVNSIPRNMSAPILMDMKDRGPLEPQQIGSSRLMVIQQARELERLGKLQSIQIPRFSVDHFVRKAG